MSSELYSLNATIHALILTEGQYESLEVPAGSIVTLAATMLDRRFYEVAWDHRNLMVFTEDWKTNAEIIHAQPPAITAAPQECRRALSGTDSPDGQRALQLAIEDCHRQLSSETAQSARSSSSLGLAVAGQCGRAI
jgi:hypothetical protein